MTKLLSFKLASALLVLFWFSGTLHAQSTTRYEIPEEDHLGFYSIDSGPGLDTGCSFRSEGPLVINLPVPVTLNPVHLNSNGTIKKEMIEKLIKNKVVSRQAKIELPVWDVDSDANVASMQPEINKVYFNGEYKYTLAGGNNKWFKQSFYVDIGEVRFGKNNIIKVEIDTANTGEYWCTAVDWVSITFDAAYPYVLAHGIDAGNDTWTWQAETELKDGAYCDDNYNAANTVQKALREEGVLCKVFFIDGEQAKGDCAKKDSFSDEKYTGKNGTAACNAKELKWKIEQFLKPLKAKKVNIIAHSKGGLDSQELEKIRTEFEIATLSTISTPHLGSVVADMQLLQQKKSAKYQLKGKDSHGYVTEYIKKPITGLASRSGVGPQLPGLNDLKPGIVSEKFNAHVRGNIRNTFTIGADAGPKCGEEELTNPQTKYLYPWSVALTEARLAYKSICNYSLVTKVSYTENVYTYRVDALNVISYTISYTVNVYTYSVDALDQSEAKRQNDISVSIHSANPPDKPVYKPLDSSKTYNHATIKNGDVIKEIFEKTKELHLHTNL